MSPISQEQAADLFSLQQSLDVEPVLIGATAFRLFFPAVRRHTEDLDIAVALELDDFAPIERRMLARGWARVPSWEQRWRGPRGSRVDILPVGPRALEVGQLVWPKGGTAMSLVGFQHVFTRAVAIKISPRLHVKAAPPPVLTLLKLVAFQDDPNRRVKDLEDIHNLMRCYELESDRLFSDAVFDAELSDIEFGPAYLLGSDLGTICGPEEKAVVDRFLKESTDSQSLLFSRLLRHETGVEPMSEDHLLARIQAFSDGFRLGNFGR